MRENPKDDLMLYILLRLLGISLLLVPLYFLLQNHLQVLLRPLSAFNF